MIVDGYRRLAPGWISRHRAVLASPHEIRVWPGKIAAEAGKTETYADNHRSSMFDVIRRQWSREALLG
jgi:hypothetical protein